MFDLTYNLYGEDIDQQLAVRLSALLSTPKGTMPGDRNYGIDYSFMDLPLEAAENTFAVEAMNAVDEYINDVSIDSVDFDIINDKIVANINLVENDEETDEDEEDIEDYEEVEDDEY
jgi:hypothetical protein